MRSLAQVLGPNSGASGALIYSVYGRLLKFLRQFCKATIEVHLKFARSGQVLGGGGGRLMRRPGPVQVALLATLGRTQAVKREAERNANEPSTEAVAIAEAIKAAVRAEERLLGDVFRIRGIAKDAAGHAIGKRPGFSEAGFELASCVGLGSLARRLLP